MASYQQLLDAFFRTVPGAQEILNTPEGGDFFNQWASEIMADLGVGTWDEIPVEELANYEYAGPDLGQSKPAEQALFDALAPTLANQIAGDATRAAEAEQLTRATGDAYRNLGQTLDLANITVGPDGRISSPLLTAQNLNADATTAAITNAADVAAAAKTGALQTLTADQLANLDQSLATQRTALEQQVRELSGNATGAAAARRAALEEQLTAIRAAQAPLAEARVRAAENEVTGINLALQGTQDDLRAEAARDGFYGGSTMQEAALARAAVDARQNAARSMGSARVANAMDDRSIADFEAGRKYSIEDALATELQRTGDLGASERFRLASTGAESGRGIRDAGATGAFNIATGLADQRQDATTEGARAKAAYFDQAFPNAVNAGQIRATLPGAEAAAKTALIPFATAGTRGAMDTLNYFGSTVTPPESTTVLTSPSQAGNAWANLGSSLVGGAFQVGDIWKPKPKAKTTGAGGANVIANPNWMSDS